MPTKDQEWTFVDAVLTCISLHRDECSLTGAGFILEAIGNFGSMQRQRGYTPASAASIAASADHVVFCFDVLSSHFNGASPPEPIFDNVYWWATFPHGICCTNREWQ